MAWCKRSDAGLPRPDLVLYLTLSAEQSRSRGGYGQERYEKEAFQEVVKENFNKLATHYWKVGLTLVTHYWKIGPKLATHCWKIGPKLATHWWKIGPNLATHCWKVGPKLDSTLVEGWF